MQVGTWHFTENDLHLSVPPLAFLFKSWHVIILLKSRVEGPYQCSTTSEESESGFHKWWTLKLDL